eukprot:TRINITY_DN12105_c0_g1_i1.p1 TRINITY_DN12105_c0_g1~~TRINITY_DN12105_c0_g1_i1.p1  ORF type:complete len:486 (+),score=117.30 TRINITY_DN12105_c0_g1_i1:62-1519(+)
MRPGSAPAPPQLLRPGPLPKDRRSRSREAAAPVSASPAAPRARIQRAGRTKDAAREIALPEVVQSSGSPERPGLRLPAISGSEADELLSLPGSPRGGEEAEDRERVTVFCACEELDREKIVELVSSRLSLTASWPQSEETLYVSLTPQMLMTARARPRSSSIPTTVTPRPPADSLREPMLRDCEQGLEPAALDAGKDFDDRCLIVFDYGVVVVWGLRKYEEQELYDLIAKPAELRTLPDRFVEKEEFDVTYCTERVHAIRNDVIKLPQKLRRHVATRMAIAYALAQSTKLCVFEEQGLDLVRSTKHLPRELALHGHISLSRLELSKLIGRLFVQRSEVDLLSSALDTPEYFWQAPDAVQDLYKKVCEYLEIEERIEAVNARLEVSQSMLDMLQNQHDVSHGVRLEWIVIVLVALEGVIGALEFCLGELRSLRHPPQVVVQVTEAAAALLGLRRQAGAIYADALTALSCKRWWRLMLRPWRAARRS